MPKCENDLTRAPGIVLKFCSLVMKKTRQILFIVTVTASLLEIDSCLGVEPPHLQSPGTTSSSGPILSENVVVFSWGVVSKASGYRLYVRDLNTKELVVNKTIRGKSNVTHTAQLEHGHEYRWNMQSLADGSASEFSDTFYFRIESPPVKPQNDSLRSRPVVTGVDPNPVPGSTSRQWITLHGKHFAPGFSVTFRDETKEVSYPRITDPDRLKFVSDKEAQVLAGLGESQARWSVVVYDQEGTSSAPFGLQVDAALHRPSDGGLRIDPKFVATKYENAFDETLGDAQRQGLLRLLRFIRDDPRVTDLRWAAYMLATAKREVGNRWHPIPEMGRAAGKLYALKDPVTGRRYYGRGYVQLTWKYNYEVMSEVVGVDLVRQPDLALVPEYAYEMMSYGMRKGMFTGLALSDFINTKKTDYINARRIVNGLDRARLIAGYAETFEEILRASKVALSETSTRLARLQVKPGNNGDRYELNVISRPRSDRLPGRHR